MSSYRVTAAAVVVKVSDQRRQVYVYRGATLPTTLAEGEAERLIKRGMIAEAAPPTPVAEPEVAPVEGGDGDVLDLDAMTVADLVEYAAASEIDLGGATRKADILATIQAAIAAE